MHRCIYKEVYSYENDIPAEKKIQSKGSWLPQENEHCKRQKGIGCQKGKGKT